MGKSEINTRFSSLLWELFFWMYQGGMHFALWWQKVAEADGWVFVYVVGKGKREDRCKVMGKFLNVFNNTCAECNLISNIFKTM